MKGLQNYGKLNVDADVKLLCFSPQKYMCTYLERHIQYIALYFSCDEEHFIFAKTNFGNTCRYLRHVPVTVTVLQLHRQLASVISSEHNKNCALASFHGLVKPAKKFWQIMMKPQHILSILHLECNRCLK